MITHPDDGPEFEPDDPLAVILRPSSDYLGPPAGRYETIRRRAGRRRLLRAAAVGVGASCAVAALVALPLHLTAHEAPAPPTVPMAPPVRSPTTGPPASATPGPEGPRPTPEISSVPSDPGGGSGRDPSASRNAPSKTATIEPSMRPSIEPPVSSAVEPSAARSTDRTEEAATPGPRRF
ncbi:hypothetical protein ABZ027_12920 [Streptomyces sp. NPDC006332]|uniref:hypothetical protein n=1 Tax=Streptomyces sp. NPDC006332 TaxID=3155456 RepID=UPI0033A4AB7D